jgi:hypothetical protein
MLEKIKEFQREILVILVLFIALYAVSSYVISPTIQSMGGGIVVMFAAAGIFFVCPILVGAYGGYIMAKKDRGRISLLLPGAVIALGLLLVNMPLLITWGMMNEAEFKQKWENNIKALDNKTKALYEEAGALEYDPEYRTMATFGLIFSLMMDVPIMFALGAAGAWAGRKINVGR